MPYLVGALLALAIGAAFTLFGIDRDRAFYPTILAVIASYYVLFAVMGGSSHALLVESTFFALFFAAAVVGFRRSLWIVALALAAHGIFDHFHHQMISNPGVPQWWASFCLAYDVVAAGFLACLLLRRVIPVHAR